MKNPVDSVVEFFSPNAALRRRASRLALAKYDAAEPSRLRRFSRDRSQQNLLVQQSGEAIRTQVRHLVRNHDLARGALRSLVNNIAGQSGIGIEPQPRRRDGTIHKEYRDALMEAYRDWCRKPEVTHQLTMAKMQRALVRSWIRDGEVFGQYVIGRRADLDHGTRVPMSLECFEADMVPLSLQSDERRIAQGIERNAWGRPVGLHVYKSDPWRVVSVLSADTKRIPWDRVFHIATMDNIGQMRGVSEFASVITRLEDIKDYEESERVAAKIAAMLTGYIKKGTPDTYSDESSGDDAHREINFDAGMIIDDLMPGEDIGLLDSKRPNPNLITFRQGQLRAVAAGIGGSNSTISKDYNGSYSSQRQELVEQWINYAVLADDFVGSMLAPTWRRFVQVSNASGVVPQPVDVAEGTEDDAIYIAQSMPWIDPLKEALGNEALVKAGFASELEIIRRRGSNPRDVLDQITVWRQECAERGLVFSSNEAALEAAKLAAAQGER
jgi:lambda family phage portal protein